MLERIKKNGFTLVELLVVISIMGILISLALVSYDGARKSARDGRRKSDLEQVRNALEMRRLDCGAYSDTTLYSGQSIMGSAPVPPCTALCCVDDVYITIPNDPGGRQYVYVGHANSYDICASLELETGGVPTNCPAGSDGCGTGHSCNTKVSNP